MKITSQQAQGLLRTLTRLFDEQNKRCGPNDYLVAHGRPQWLKHHVNVFAWYAGLLPEAGAILDWGCRHGPDSCLLREAFQEKVDLHACDFFAESEFPVFHEHSRASYQQLTGALDLPYQDNTFDAVIGSGVLEHTAMDQEALKGLYRILKPNGLVVLTYIPYRWSRAEWQLRHIKKAGFHRRLYGRGEISTLLKRNGFYPIELGFHAYVTDTINNGRKTVRQMLRYITPPIFHSVMLCAARKMNSM